MKFRIAFVLFFLFISLFSASQSTTFYVSPKGDDSNPEKMVNEIDFNGKTWDEWNAAGNDVHSVYADPLFYDAENFDSRLKENSPAFQLGFQAIDLSKTGLQKKLDHRTESTLICLSRSRG